MKIKFHELLLSELRMAVYRPGNPERLTDELLCKAVTLNENLQSLGYVLRPDDLAKIAVSPSMDSFFDHVRSLVPDVKAEPMYPGFPQQVMSMSEAEFRMHQMIHYFSTYGMEELFGDEVSRGWLPEYHGPARILDDTSLLNSRVIELVCEESAAGTALRTVLSRRERLTNPELELATMAASLCDASQLKGIIIRFKENLDLLFPRVMTLEDRDAALEILFSICAHSGDVMRCTAAYLREKRWHLSTSEKKLLVKLLERYSAWNFRENLMQSLQKREQNLKILQHLDYNRFSASREHREIVCALRNDELMSWHGVGEKLLREENPGALTHLAERPGYMLRMLNRLLSLGYSEDQILAVMTPKADKLSAHLILKTLRTLSARSAKIEEIRVQELRKLHSASYDSVSVRILKTLLKEHFRMVSTPLKGKKVFCSLEQFDLSHSCLETEDRSKDGGYVRSGISWKIPEEAKYVRFFVYWNDERRVDVDLHAGGVTTDGGSLHVGWNSDFRDSGVVHSGDITHSDAAEYIDIDLSAPVKEIYANVNLFSGRPSFKEIETCYVGLMAVDRAKQDVKHYNPKNCFFTHRLSQNTKNLFYGVIDVQNRFVRFIGQPNSRGWAARPDLENAENMFSLQDYLDCLLEAQNAEPADSESEAEVVLTMEKGLSDKSVSLVDHNFFLEC